MIQEPTVGKGGAFAPPDLTQELPVVCNTADNVLGGNIRAAYARKLPIVDFILPHRGVALLVGGGPSLERDLDELRSRQYHGEKIFALNGAGLYLTEKGIIPDAVVMMDARAMNARFILGLPKTTKLYLAMQCAPEVFDAAEGYEVITWHAANGGLSGVVEERPAAFICGGTVVGIRSMHLVCVLGYREVHVFGYDSSFKDGKNHAYAQPENDDDRPVECFVHGRAFMSTPWMIRQADDFQLFTAKLMQVGVVVGVHGDGLLPHIAECMIETGDTMDTIYDFALAPSSWDFYEWLTRAHMEKEARGYKKLAIRFKRGPKDGFRNDELPVSLEMKQKIYANVIRPLVHMTGAEYGTHEWGHHFDYTRRAIATAYEQGAKVPFFDPPAEAMDRVARYLKGRHPIVITLREATHWTMRNSNLGAWLYFAKQCGEDVIIVRDTEKSDMTLGPSYEICPQASTDTMFRFALYKQARLNMSVPTGPAINLQLSTNPYLIFQITGRGPMTTEPAWLEAYTGMRHGDHVQWALPHQRMIWKDDDYENIVQAYTDILPVLPAFELQRTA